MGGIKIWVFFHLGKARCTKGNKWNASLWRRIKTPHLLPSVSLLLFLLFCFSSSVLIHQNKSRWKLKQVLVLFFHFFSIFRLWNSCTFPVFSQIISNFHSYRPFPYFVFFLPSFRFFPELLYQPILYYELYFAIKDGLKNGEAILS